MIWMLIGCLTATTTGPVEANEPLDGVGFEVLEEDCGGANSVLFDVPVPAIYQVEWCVDGACSNDGRWYRNGAELAVACGRPDHETIRVTLLY